MVLTTSSRRHYIGGQAPSASAGPSGERRWQNHWRRLRRRTARRCNASMIPDAGSKNVRASRPDGENFAGNAAATAATPLGGNRIDIRCDFCSSMVEQPPSPLQLRALDADDTANATGRTIDAENRWRISPTSPADHSVSHV